MSTLMLLLLLALVGLLVLVALSHRAFMRRRAENHQRHIAATWSDLQSQQ